MVDRAELTKASQLDGELRMLYGALENLDSGGAIVGFLVTRGPPTTEQQQETGLSVMMNAVQVPTVGISYPSSVVNQIKQAVQQRIDQIENEMQRMGITGGRARARAAPAQPAARQPAQRPTQPQPTPQRPTAQAARPRPQQRTARQPQRPAAQPERPAQRPTAQAARPSTRRR